MGLGDWWRRLMNREDERRHSSSDVTGLEDDEFAARTFHEGNVEDAERLSDES